MNEQSFSKGDFSLKRQMPKYKQIIDAAIEVIADHGYHQSQVAKIAKQARVADGTIYLYFRNKEDIFISMFREKMGEFIETIREKINKKSLASEQLYVLIENHYKILSANPKLAIVTQLELRQTNKHLRKEINNILKDYLLLIDYILQKGIENGEFRKDLHIRLARQMIFGTIDETVTTWVMNDQKYDLVSLTPDVHRLLLQGCANTH